MGMIRMFLALSVVIHHLSQRSFQWLDAGAAVMAFFVISGFYMALVINEKYRGMDSWRRRFYEARLLRIFPAYLFVLIAGVMVHAANQAAFAEYFRLELWKQISLVLMNVFIVGQDLFQTVLMTPVKGGQNAVVDSALAALGPEYFRNEYMIIGQAWSLSSELMFYAIAPFIVTSWRRVFAGLLLSLVLRTAILLQPDVWPPTVWGSRFPASTLTFFCLGALSYHAHAWLCALETGARLRWAKAAGMAASALFLYWAGSQSMAGSFLYLEKGDHYDTHTHWTFYLGLAVSLPFVFRISRNWGYDRLIGELSYPLYLVHGFVIGTVVNLQGVSGGTFATEAAIIVFSLGMAALVYVLVDAPVERLRRSLEAGRGGAGRLTVTG
ncbi:MAG: acyltransferase [Gammaproteobacteria bacterium]|nr:acyltransferase [Gammaproteobacteria bacterium]